MLQVDLRSLGLDVDSFHTSVQELMWLGRYSKVRVLRLSRPQEVLNQPEILR